MVFEEDIYRKSDFNKSDFNKNEWMNKKIGDHNPLSDDNLFQKLFCILKKISTIC